MLQSGREWVTVAIELKPRTGVVRFLPPHHSGPNSFPALPLRKDSPRWHFGVSTSTVSIPRIDSRFPRGSAPRSPTASFSPRASTPASGSTRPPEFEQLSDTFLSPHSPFGRDARQLRRRFHGGSFDEKLDSAGRIRLPKPLIEHAGLDGNCVVIGAGEYLEIWDAEAWAKQEEELDAAAPEIAEGLAAAGTA